MKRNIKTKIIGDIKFNDYKINNNLKQRCHMTITLDDGSIMRCCGLAEFEVRKQLSVFESFEFGGINAVYCKIHSIQISFSDPELKENMRSIKSNENKNTKKQT